MRSDIISAIFRGVNTDAAESLTRRLPLALAAVALAVAVSACGASGSAAGSGGAAGRIVAVGAENQYANVISQIGGRYVNVTAIMRNPNTDPHTFEASPSVASTVAAARLVVQNGLGYDSFMNKIEAASPSRSRRVIEVQTLLGLPASTRNPHLWYDPSTMPRVAAAIVRDLSALAPAHAAYFSANGRRFDATLRPWLKAIASFKHRHAGTPVAVTEPVADYMLQAAGAEIRTPWVLQADIMNGVDPAPQDVTLQDNLFNQHRVKVFLYNRQVTNTVTQAFLKLAEQDHIPVVGVYETMPTGYSYGSWMLAETRALNAAVTDRRSTGSL
jgi:zinc/manganese transport system substrate-binding protein